MILPDPFISTKTTADWPYSDLTVGGIRLTGITVHIETAAATSSEPISKHFSVTCGATAVSPQTGETVLSVHFNLLNARGRLLDIIYNDNVVLNSGIANCSADNAHWIVTNNDPTTVQLQLRATHIVDFAPVDLQPGTKH